MQSDFCKVESNTGVNLYSKIGMVGAVSRRCSIVHNHTAVELSVWNRLHVGHVIGWDALTVTSAFCRLTTFSGRPTLTTSFYVTTCPTTSVSSPSSRQRKVHLTDSFFIIFLLISRVLWTCCLLPNKRVYNHSSPTLLLAELGRKCTHIQAYHKLQTVLFACIHCVHIKKVPLIFLPQLLQIVTDLCNFSCTTSPV